jgi:hypothetical protein
MDRSLVEMESRRPGTVRSGRIGTTVTKQTTSPRNGTVVELLHWQNILMNAGDVAARGPNPIRAVCFGWSAHRAPRPVGCRPDGTGLHAANDAGRRRDSEPAVATAVRQPSDQHPSPTRSSAT